MAKGLNAHLGALLYASNQTQEMGAPPPVPRMMAFKTEAQSVKPLAINPQKIEQSATVYAVFAIE
jgi:uncharacterized protein YggE